MIVFISSEVICTQIHLQNGFSPLWMASQNGYVDVVTILLQYGAHVDVQTEVSVTFQ